MTIEVSAAGEGEGGGGRGFLTHYRSEVMDGTGGAWEDPDKLLRSAPRGIATVSRTQSLGH